MSWLAVHRSEELFSLLENPTDFCLLMLIAARARFQEDPCPVTGLRYGQAFIGDYKSAGIKSRQAYRLSIRRLADRKFCTIQGTNKGTIATLLPQAIFSISTPTKEPSKEPSKNHQGTIQEPLTNKVTRKQGNEDLADLFVMDAPEVVKPKKPRFNPMTTRIKNRTPEMDLIGSCFGNPEEVVWTTMESQLLKALAPTLEEIQIVRDFYSYDLPENGYRNRNVKTLIQNWSAQLIAAREFFDRNPELKTA